MVRYRIYQVLELGAGVDLAGAIYHRVADMVDGGQFSLIELPDGSVFHQDDLIVTTWDVP